MGRWTTWLIIGLLFVLHFYPFDFASFRFIQYDDEMFIRPMLNVGPADYFAKWFPSPYTYAYPVRDATFFFDQWLSKIVGLETYHYTSFVFYLVTVLAFSCLLRLFFPQRPLLVAACLMLAFVHPLNLEIVQWVSARKNLMPAMFVLWGVVITFRAFLAGRPLQAREWLALIFLQLSSLACYPTSTLWLIWVILLQASHLSRRQWYAALGGAVLLSWAYVKWTARGDSDFDQSFGLLLEQPQRIGYFLVRSLGRGFYNLVLPTQLSMFYDEESVYNHIGFCLFLAYGGLMGVALRRIRDKAQRTTILCVLGLMVALAGPQAHVFLSFSDFRWADRYAFILLPYFVLFNALVFTAPGVWLPTWLPQQELSRRQLAAAAMAVITIFYAYLVRERVPLWRDAIAMQAECAAHEGAPKCVAAMISTYFATDCQKARPYINQGYQRYLSNKPRFDGQLVAELPFYDATCIALTASASPAEKLAAIPPLFDKYPGSPGPVFGLTLAYLEAGQFGEALKLAETYTLSGQGGMLGATKLLLQIYFGHTAALCELSGQDDCWAKRRILVESNKQIPEKSPMGHWGHEISMLMHERSKAPPPK